MMQEAELVFRFHEATAAAIHGALVPDKDGQAPKMAADVTTDGDELRVRLRAEDLPSLRAAVNSYARWIDAAERAARAGR